MADNLPSLPSKLLLWEPVDELDVSYLNLSHHLIMNPLKKILDINLYHDKFYTPTPSEISPKFYYSNKK